jgi:hypothetical protein
MEKYSILFEKQTNSISKADQNSEKKENFTNLSAKNLLQT